MMSASTSVNPIQNAAPVQPAISLQIATTSKTADVANEFAWTPWTVVGAVTGFTASAMHISSMTDNSAFTPAVIFAGVIGGVVGAATGAVASFVSKAVWVSTKLEAPERKAS